MLKFKTSPWVLALTLVLSPGFVLAQVECGGSIKQENFADNIKQLNSEIQANVDEYRKLEITSKQLPEGSPERTAATKRLKEINAEVTKQRTTFKELNSPVFPETQFTVYGAACTDRRWILKAKEVLVAKPEYLGRHFHVWMDKTSREVQVSQTRPEPAKVAN